MPPLFCAACDLITEENAKNGYDLFKSRKKELTNMAAENINNARFTELTKERSRCW